MLAEKSGEVIEKPRLQQSEMAVLEDELKPEYDILNNIVKIISTTKGNLEMCLNENRNLFETMEQLRSELHGELEKVLSVLSGLTNSFNRFVQSR